VWKLAAIPDTNVCGREIGHSLIVGLPQVLISLLSFLLQKLQSTLQSLILCQSRRSLILLALVLLNRCLQLLDLALQLGILVRERSDFVVFAKILLLEDLDLGLKLLDLGSGFVGLDAEGVHFLLDAIHDGGGEE